MELLTIGNIIFIAVILLAAAGLIYVSYRLEKRRKKYMNGIKKFEKESVRFDGMVTSTAKGYIMLKFRDEAQKKTVHHKYTYARKRYKPENEVTVYYNEENDCACVEGDNPFVHKAVWCALGSAACFVVATAVIIVGIITVIK